MNKDTCEEATAAPAENNKKAASENTSPSPTTKWKDACGDATETEMVKYSPDDAEFKEWGPQRITVKVH